MENKLTIIDFLKGQDKPSYLCVIKIVKDDPLTLQLIRWVEEKKRCDFIQYVIVDMDVIDFVYPTEHFCFIDDKKHAVVEIVFKENATVPVANLLDLAWRKGKYFRFKTVEEILAIL